jgi:hypothetical protein
MPGIYLVCAVEQKEKGKQPPVRVVPTKCTYVTIYSEGEPNPGDYRKKFEKLFLSGEEEKKVPLQAPTEERLFKLLDSRKIKILIRTEGDKYVDRGYNLFSTYPDPKKPGSFLLYNSGIYEFGSKKTFETVSSEKNLFRGNDIVRAFVGAIQPKDVKGRLMYNDSSDPDPKSPMNVGSHVYTIQ